ncbi:hypothetical protein N7468_001028 [Penicillium chermesinum]|uniref:Xylanolytic transcriptional activator regulatory domain-containing protein n=1 Tax=Penicillium chermesinum TaxID=63820 RepID=A0A9W9PFZ1_9EURO|nr:uncharacterized protein N7468_001028 [Penicillium chermesinum]KAJ5246045.1 hypothetical protein N7468_001028 [Penicillium chermesinum]
MEPPEYAPTSSEIGSLTAHSNEDSQFVGSSSGVYFINTVKRAFSDGLDRPDSQEPDFPVAEDTLVGTEDSSRPKRRRTTSRETPTASSPDDIYLPEWTYDPTIASFLGDAPPQDTARELMMMYFKVWHPLFPFLHGPTFLQAMERLYSKSPQEERGNSTSTSYKSTCWTVILQCIFNLGSLLGPDLRVPPESRIMSPASMTQLLSTFASKHDMASLQALLAVQVYLVATMSLRLASTFGGCILRSMMHAGLHRCPFRYSQLSSHDRHLRKRIFWCAYAIDRYLSQALGLPLGIQDSDIDVCLPAAKELHFSREIREYGAISFDAENFDHSDPDNSVFRGYDREQAQIFEGDNRKKESILASYVDSGTLTGRALELFHKSILVRSVRRSPVLFLVTDVHKWWNSLPLELQGTVAGTAKRDGAESHSPFDFGPFFAISYQHLILIIHRPSLSLDPLTAEFCSGLQTCIGAARGIIAALKTQVNNGQALFWPGFLSAAWMSGLVLAFACQLRQYVLAIGLQEINDCSEFLRRMSDKWETASHCNKALLILATKIKQMDSNPEASKSLTYAMSTPGRELGAVDPAGIREQGHLKQRKLSSSYFHGIDTSPPLRVDEPLAPECQSSEPQFVASNGNRGLHLTDTSPSSLEFGFQSGSNHLPGGSNFDLNMVDLLHGADFDSLFDMIGQQYPSF